MKSLFIALIMCIGLTVAAQKNKRPFPMPAEIKPEVMDIEKFHRYHINEFSKAEGFGETRIVIMPKIIQLVVGEKTYFMSNMRLISVTDRKTPVIWEYPAKNPENLVSIIEPVDRRMIKNKYMKKRNPDKNESDWLKSLKSGKSHVEVIERGVLKIIAPLKAENVCIRCHKDYKKGDFMGAFLYDMQEQRNSLNKKDEKNHSENEKPVKVQSDENSDKVGLLVK